MMRNYKDVLAKSKFMLIIYILKTYKLFRVRKRNDLTKLQVNT